MVGGDGEIVVKVLDGSNLGNGISLARARFRGVGHGAPGGDGDQQGRAEGSSGKETPQGRLEKWSVLPRRAAVPGRPVSVKLLEKCRWPGGNCQAFLQPRPPRRSISNPAGGRGDCNNSLLLLLPWMPTSLHRRAVGFCGPGCGTLGVLMKRGLLRGIKRGGQATSS